MEVNCLSESNSYLLALILKCVDMKHGLQRTFGKDTNKIDWSKAEVILTVNGVELPIVGLFETIKKLDSSRIRAKAKYLVDQEMSLLFDRAFNLSEHLDSVLEEMYDIEDELKKMVERVTKPREARK